LTRPDEFFAPAFETFIDAALIYICFTPGLWRATGWEIVQHFLAQRPEQMRSENR
jgi:hypothetical protein